MTYRYPKTRADLFDDLAPTIDETVRYRIGLYLNELHGAPPANLHRIVMECAERAAINAVLAYTDGNQALAAQYLGIGRQSLIRKLQASR
jgi:Fis family transcriptional regulator